MHNPTNITIVTVCDSHYIVLLAALIKSIEVNHKSGEEIDLYIVNDNISAQNERKLNESIKSTGIHITWLKMENVIPADMKLPLDNTSFPPNVYTRVYIPYFVPSHIKKVLYLDVDMILNTDISGLWNTDMGDHTIAGVVDRAETVDSWGGISNYKELRIPAGTKYFNSGLLLIDTFKWRAANMTAKIVQCTIENVKHVSFADQYGINVVFANQWLELDRRWNCYAVSSEENPYLIHFIGRKPIYKTYDYNENYKNKFYEYLRLTMWKNYKPVSESQRLIKKGYNKIIKKILGIGR